MCFYVIIKVSLSSDLSHLCPTIQKQPRDLDMAIHAGLHQGGVHLISFVLLARCKVNKMFDSLSIHIT